jgi:hypothetical protein
VKVALLVVTKVVLSDIEKEYQSVDSTVEALVVALVFEKAY